MALSRGASNPDPDPDDIRPLKPCLLRRNHNRDQHGVAASCLEELRRKACEVLAIDESLTPVTLVLAEDGTIVDDDDYFLCLPSNTKFVALACNEKWTYNNSDGGTAWVSQESFDADETDSRAGVKWKNVARQLKEDLSSIILPSEEDLQVLIDIPCSELARELCQSCATVERLQDALQQVLDQREEAHQSKQLLELYLQALEKEGAIFSNQEEPKAALCGDVDAVDTGIGKEMASEVALTSQILTVLKEKPIPELSLSNQDLELVSKEDPRALAVALSGDIKKAETVQRACNAELALRLRQVQSLRSLRNVSVERDPLPEEQQSPKRVRQDPK
ncbi:LOW QUALITY PROTEIN: DNA fragmentation factor subunit alpha-like [Microtus ochrogaster]|uniref:LOW QUALITY PROTEIN: DNAation factor subunit alpha-like n=1 Tax=Microtus ochrogaster TaxID=79684 RepID=A0ABM1AW25_MICOH|nr:LOW QUALITY PROTEIN: DNA fragmentation factor subunit alpha-like [Microtus ochrogaster]